MTMFILDTSSGRTIYVHIDVVGWRTFRNSNSFAYMCNACLTSDNDKHLKWLAIEYRIHLDYDNDDDDDVDRDNTSWHRTCKQTISFIFQKLNALALLFMSDNGGVALGTANKIPCFFIFVRHFSIVGIAIAIVRLSNKYMQKNTENINEIMHAIKWPIITN